MYLDGFRTKEKNVPFFLQRIFGLQISDSEVILVQQTDKPSYRNVRMYLRNSYNVIVDV